LASGPENVLWLAPREKVALLGAIYREDNQGQDTGRGSGGLLTQILRLAALPSATYFLLMSGLYTMSFWIPRILQNFELSFREIGWTTSLIFAVGDTALIVWSLYANRSLRPQYHLAAAFALAGVGLALAATRTTFLAEAGFAMAASGVLAGMPTFWGSVRSGSGSEGSAKRNHEDPRRGSVASAQRVRSGIRHETQSFEPMPRDWSLSTIHAKCRRMDA
jgi:hypothetical protein